MPPTSEPETAAFILEPTVFFKDRYQKRHFTEYDEAFGSRTIKQEQRMLAVEKSKGLQLFYKYCMSQVLQEQLLGRDADLTKVYEYHINQARLLLSCLLTNQEWSELLHDGFIAPTGTIYGRCIDDEAHHLYILQEKVEMQRQLFAQALQRQEKILDQRDFLVVTFEKIPLSEYKSLHLEALLAIRKLHIKKQALLSGNIPIQCVQ